MIEYVVFVTGHYHWLLGPFLALHKKYFDVPLLFFTDRPIDANHKIIFKRDCKIYHEPVGKVVKNHLRQIDKPLVSLMLIDLLPKEQVNMKWLNILAQFMVDKPIARGNLFGYDGQLVHQEKLTSLGGLGIYKVSPFDQHIGLIGSTSLNPAIWNKEFLLEFIEDDWPLDRIEIPGHSKFKQQNKWYSIGTVPSIVQMSHLCYTAAPNLVRLSEMKDEDKHYVEPFIPKGYEID